MTRHDCDPFAGKGTDVFVDNCGVGLCNGAQKWKYDDDTRHVAAQIHGPCAPSDPEIKAESVPVDGDLCNCLDISVKRNVAQTWACKDKSKVGGLEKHYCGDANQEWTLESDGTFSVPTPPQSMCAAALSCDKPAGPGCDKVCLVTAAAPSGKPPDTVDHAGACIETAGSLAWQFVALVLGGGMLYLCGGVAYGKRQGVDRHWSEALSHREFWANCAGLVLDGVRFATGKSITIGREGSYKPIDRVDRAGSAPPPPPSSSPPRAQTDEERWEVEGARRRNKDMKKKKSSSNDKKKEKPASGKSKKDKRGEEAGVVREVPPRPSGSDSSAEGPATQQEEQQRLLEEHRDERLHSSQAKIKVVGING